MTATDALKGYAADLALVMERRGNDKATARAVQYRSRIGPDYQCPGCWMTNERAEPLVAVPGGEREDRFRCHACGSDFSVPLG